MRFSQAHSPILRSVYQEAFFYFLGFRVLLGLVCCISKIDEFLVVLTVRQSMGPGIIPQMLGYRVTVEENNHLAQAASMENWLLNCVIVLLEVFLVFCDCHLMKDLCVVPHNAKSNLLSTEFASSLIII